MTHLGRRTLFAAALALPALVPGSALAAIKIPLKPKPARVKPLGVWSLANAQPSADVGDVASVDLYFRPAVDIDQPVMRWWVPRWQSVGATPSRVCAPLDLSNQQLLGPVVAGALVPVHIDIAVPVPPKPQNVGQGEMRSDLVRERQTGRRKRVYRAFVDMADPATCRRASFGFNIAVLDDYP
jgi:hypothetical protein